jgi:hypothetical protein
VTVNECYEDKYGRSCIVFSGVKKFSDVYDWLFNHYNGYKFAILLDCSMSEYPEPDSKIYVHFLDELHDEVAMEAGYIRADKDKFIRR